MKIPTATWVSGVALCLGAGVVLNSADLILVSLLGGAIGLGARSVLALRDHWEARRSLTADEARLEELEWRLQMAEQVLASRVSVNHPSAPGAQGGPLEDRGAVSTPIAPITKAT
jgi:hypothetical protein